MGYAPTAAVPAVAISTAGSTSLWSHGVAMRCPEPPPPIGSSLPTVLRLRCAVSGTEDVYAMSVLTQAMSGTVLRLPYAMSSTDLRHTMQCP
eukprot:975502-Rhodomonas_salina.1